MGIYAIGTVIALLGGSVFTVAIAALLLSFGSCITVAATDPVIRREGYCFGAVFAAVPVGFVLAVFGLDPWPLFVAIVFGMLYPLAMAATYGIRHRRGNRTYHVSFSHHSR
jgi:4-hydroxybenzoate polyprenyltransferase